VAPLDGSTVFILVTHGSVQKTVNYAVAIDRGINDNHSQ
jgi:hypothetical protein